MIHRDGRVALARDLDPTLDQADDVAVGRGFAPQIRAADAGRHRRHRNADVAPPRPREDLGREPESTLRDIHYRHEHAVLARLDRRQPELRVLAELHRAAVGELHQEPCIGAGAQRVVRPERRRRARAARVRHPARPMRASGPPPRRPARAPVRWRRRPQPPARRPARSESLQGSFSGLDDRGAFPSRAPDHRWSGDSLPSISVRGLLRRHTGRGCAPGGSIAQV